MRLHLSMSIYSHDNPSLQTVAPCAGCPLSSHLFPLLARIALWVSKRCRRRKVSPHFPTWLRNVEYFLSHQRSMLLDWRKKPSHTHQRWALCWAHLVQMEKNFRKCTKCSARKLVARRSNLSGVVRCDFCGYRSNQRATGPLQLEVLQGRAAFRCGCRRGSGGRKPGNGPIGAV